MNLINEKNNQPLNPQIQITKRRGRPRKHNNIESNNSDLSFIEQDIIVCFPIILQNLDSTNTEILSDTYNNENIEYFISNQTSQNKITNINALQSIIEQQENIIKKYKQQLEKYNINNTSINSEKIKITQCKCPFETKNNFIVVPKNTKLCCMYDTCKINGVPFFLPNSYENGQFNICGWFCSLNCALAYNISLKDEHISKRYSLLYYLYNITNTVITPSPNYLLLKKFGGIYTIEEYRDKLFKETNNYRLLTSPMSYTPLTLEERTEI